MCVMNRMKMHGPVLHHCVHLQEAASFSEQLVKMTWPVPAVQSRITCIKSYILQAAYKAAQAAVKGCVF